MPNKTRHQQITQSDLATPHSFREWIKNNLNHIYIRKEIPADHLLIYLDYIKTVIGKDDKIDVPSWMDFIRQLETKLESIKKVE